MVPVSDLVNLGQYNFARTVSSLQRQIKLIVHFVLTQLDNLRLSLCLRISRRGYSLHLENSTLS